jgi:hypothetical protein
MELRRKGVILLGMVIFFATLHCGRNTNPPQSLIGVWGTDDPRYAGRTFEVGPNTLMFQTGERQFETYPIAGMKVQKGAMGKNDLYTFSYKKDGQALKFSFYYSVADQNVIRFLHQDKMSWTRQAK